MPLDFVLFFSTVVLCLKFLLIFKILSNFTTFSKVDSVLLSFCEVISVKLSLNFSSSLG